MRPQPWPIREEVDGLWLGPSLSSALPHNRERDGMSVTDILGAGPLRLMHPRELAAELADVIAACDETAYAVPQLSDLEFRALMTDRFPKAAPGNGTDWRGILSERERRTVGLQAHRLRQILERLPAFAKAGQTPQWCLVPNEWRRRMSVLLGACTVPLAWVDLADGLQEGDP